MNNKDHLVGQLTSEKCIDEGHDGHDGGGDDHESHQPKIAG